MPPAATRPPALWDEEVGRLIETLKGADSVERKLTVPEPHQRSTAAALELDPLEAQIRQVFFFETPELALQEQGVVVRARRLRLLRDAEGVTGRGRRAPRGQGRAAAQKALLEGATAALREACAGGNRPRRTRDPRPDLRPQAAPVPTGARSEARGGDVALSRRLPDPRAVHPL